MFCTEFYKNDVIPEYNLELQTQQISFQFLSNGEMLVAYESEM